MNIALIVVSVLIIWLNTNIASPYPPKWLNRTLVVAWLILVACAIAGCTPAPANPAPKELPDAFLTEPLPPVHVERVAYDSAFIVFMEQLRLRWSDNKNLPDEETLLCLYGPVDAGKAVVAFVKPTITRPMGSSMLSYKECPKVNPALFPNIRYLGTIHTHMGGVDCAFSQPDMDSFAADDKAMIDLVVCSKGLVVTAR